MTAAPRQTRGIRSCSGARGGAQPQLHTAADEKLVDQQFALAAARRLGRKVAASPSNDPLRCSQRSASGVVPGSVLDEFGFQPTICPLGGWVVRCHKGVLRHIGARLRQDPRAQVVIDQRVPQLHRPARSRLHADARLDLVVTYPDGAAAESAEGTKLRRYAVQAIPFTLGHGGRWGEMA